MKAIMVAIGQPLFEVFFSAISKKTNTMKTIKQKQFLEKYSYSHLDKSKVVLQ